MFFSWGPSRKVLQTRLDGLIALNTRLNQDLQDVSDQVTYHKQQAAYCHGQAVQYRTALRAARQELLVAREDGERHQATIVALKHEIEELREATASQANTSDSLSGKGLASVFLSALAGLFAAWHFLNATVGEESTDVESRS